MSLLCSCTHNHYFEYWGDPWYGVKCSLGVVINDIPHVYEPEANVDAKMNINNVLKIKAQLCTFKVFNPLWDGEMTLSIPMKNFKAGEKILIPGTATLSAGEGRECNIESGYVIIKQITKENIICGNFEFDGTLWDGTEVHGTQGVFTVVCKSVLLNKYRTEK